MNRNEIMKEGRAIIYTNNNWKGRQSYSRNIFSSNNLLVDLMVSTGNEPWAIKPFKYEILGGFPEPLSMPNLSVFEMRDLLLMDFLFEIFD